MEELITNLHIHTIYSDGTGNHSEVAAAALDAGIDVVIVTDHNTWVNGVEGYHEKNSHKVLLLSGEEIHDQGLSESHNHLIVLGAGRELSTYASNPQQLIDMVNRSDGLSFIAHPYEDAMPFFGETNITWVNWDIQNFTGLELWNGLSELKTVAHNVFQAIFYAFFPFLIAHGPKRAVMEKWDALLKQGQRVSGICGSDAHQLHLKKGPIKKTIFPYQFHFRCINNHLLTPQKLSGDLIQDRKMIMNALRNGNSYIGYDYPRSTSGFRFSAQSMEKTASMGDEVILNGNITLQVKVPGKAECVIIKDGKPLKAWKNREIYTLIVDQPGVYRVECALNFMGQRRSWIISNPIFIRAK